MAKREPEILIEDIGQSLEKIGRYLEGLVREQFLADDKTIDAVVRNLEIIGEVVKNLPEEWKEKYPKTEWAQIAGLRN